MVIKYYGSSKVTHYVGWTSCHAVTAKLYATNPYKNVSGDSNPSYCVLIVPGTVDLNGDDVTFGPVNY
jgi:hypothetical protein